MSDESDHYPLFQQKELRAVMEGYIGKPNSNPTIVLVSTPKAPGGLMQQIELEQDSLYHKLFFDYKYGLARALIPSIQKNRYRRLDYHQSLEGNMNFNILA